MKKFGAKVLQNPPNIDYYGVVPTAPVYNRPYSLPMDEDPYDVPMYNYDHLEHPYQFEHKPSDKQSSLKSIQNEYLEIKPSLQYQHPETFPQQPNDEYILLAKQ